MLKRKYRLLWQKRYVTGNIGVMDYVNYKNIQADTGMRDSISNFGGDKEATEIKKELILEKPFPGKGMHEWNR